MTTTAGPEALRAWTNRWADVLHRVALAGIVVSVLCIMWAMPMEEFATQLRLRSQGQQMMGSVIFVASFLVLALFSLPIWPMPLVAGAAFGKLWGTMLASGACVLAAAATFFIARGLRARALRQYLEASPRMRALEKAVDVGDWKIVAAVRLSHVLPFGMQNYGFGLTKINFWTFALTTWLVTLPGIFLQVWLGDLGLESVGAWSERGGGTWTSWLLQAGGALLLLAALAYVAYLGKSVYWNEAEEQLNRQLEREQQESGSPVWPVAALLLTAMMFVLAGLAVWSIIERDVIADYVTRML